MANPDLEIETSGNLMGKYSLGVLLLGLTLDAGCAAEPLSHPLNTAAVPANAKVLEKCSAKGEMACSLWSFFSRDAGSERHSACSAYIDADGTRVEACGALPASQP